MICGFTARITTSASRTQRALSAVGGDAELRGRAGPRGRVRTSVAAISLRPARGWRPASPLMSASPMLPPPTNPTRLPLTLMRPDHRAGRARPEDRGADPDHRRAFLDRHLEVAAHAHRQLAQPVLARPARAGARNQGRESSARSTSGGIAMSPRTRTWAERADRVERLAHRVGRDAALARLAGHVHLRAARRPPALRGRPALQLARQLQTVERLDDVEQRAARP